MDDEWGRIPLSLLTHAGYCLRRAALIANERLWSENADTAKGREEHCRVHDQRIERRGDSLLLYEYEVFSDRWGIGGKCDTIEAVRDPDGCRIPSVDFPVRLYPVEQKHGKLRDEIEYEIQLCAQAICLEEMFGTHISEGAIYYVSSHRRQPVLFTDDLRKSVIGLIAQVDELRKSDKVPEAVAGPKCHRCSMRDLCMPDLKKSAKTYCARLSKEATEVDPL